MRKLIELPESDDNLYSDHSYVSEDGRWSMKRENGLTPHGNPLNGKWVLRNNGQFVDFDRYRSDLAGRNGFEIVY